MKKVDALFVLGVAAVILIFWLLPSRLEQNPKIPVNSTHSPLTDTQRCATCHVPNGPNPMNPRHPNKDRCFACHRSAAPK